MFGHMGHSLDRLYAAVIDAQYADPEKSRTARLLRAGRAKMAKKLAEEAIEVVLDATNGNREAVVRESADLLYNLVVLWVAPAFVPRTCGMRWNAASACSGSPRSSSNQRPSRSLTTTARRLTGRRCASASTESGASFGGGKAPATMDFTAAGR